MNNFDPLHSTYGRRMFLSSVGVGASAMLGLSGCSSPPKPPPPTTVDLRVVADADVNPDARGRPSPLSVRVYALKTSSVFDAADFFTLLEKDQATLGAELVRREELLLRPGQSHVLPLTLPDEVRVLAFMAAYRDLDRARWRTTSQVLPNQAQVLQLRCAARQLGVTRAV